MTDKEFSLLVKGLKAAYTSPNFLPDEYTLKLWFRLLKDLPYELAEAAAYKHISISKFPPTVADIRELAAGIVVQDTPDYLSGWNIVQRAIGRYGSFRKEEAMAFIISKDSMAARVVENMGWLSLCMSENPVADRANFRTCYERYVERDKEDSKLPAGLKDLINSISTSMQKQLSDLQSAKKYLEK